MIAPHDHQYTRSVRRGDLPVSSTSPCRRRDRRPTSERPRGSFPPPVRSNRPRRRWRGRSSCEARPPQVRCAAQTGRNAPQTGKRGLQIGKSAAETGSFDTQTGKNAPQTGNRGAETGKSNPPTGKNGLRTRRAAEQTGKCDLRTYQAVRAPSAGATASLQRPGAAGAGPLQGCIGTPRRRVV